jgi:hypothetical protein
MRLVTSQYEDYAAVEAFLLNEEGVEGRSLGDRILGIATMALVSAGGWTAIIAMIRLLGR